MGNLLSGLLLFASIVLAVLKLAGVLAWPWLAVLLPGIIGLGLGLLGLVIALIVMGIGIRQISRK